MRRASLAWRIPGLLLALTVAFIGAAPAALAAPGADATSTTVTIDTPPADATGSLRMYMTGWAADPGSPRGTGVDVVEIYLDGPRGGGGMFLAQAEYGIARADVARSLGNDRFSRSGFRVEADIPPGVHAVYVYAHPADQLPGQGWAGPAVLSYNALPGGPQPALANVAPTAPKGPPATGPAFQSSAWSYGAGYPFFSGGYYNYPGFGTCQQFEQPTGRCISYGGSSYTACLVGDPNSGRCLSYTSYPYGYGWPYFGFSLPYSSGSGAPYPYEAGNLYGPLNVQPGAVGYQGIYPPSNGSTGPGWTGQPIQTTPPLPSGGPPR
jgi:hypothetical protein